MEYGQFWDMHYSGTNQLSSDRKVEKKEFGYYPFWILMMGSKSKCLSCCLSKINFFLSQFSRVILMASPVNYGYRQRVIMK
jgi:hypothetical protein